MSYPQHGYPQGADAPLVYMHEPTDYAEAVLDVYKMVAFLIGAPLPIAEPSVNGSSEALAEWRRYGVK